MTAFITEQKTLSQPITLFPPKSESKQKLYRVLLLVAFIVIALSSLTGGSLALGFCTHNLFFLFLLFLPILVWVARNILSEAIYEVYVALGVLPALTPLPSSASL